MGRPSPGRLRSFTLAFTAVLLSLLAATVVPESAKADTVPRGSDPATVSTDALPTAQLNGVAWAQVIVGNTVYVGGSFTKARPAGAAAGTGELNRSNMLAYNLSDGRLTGFAPVFNAQVKALAVSSDRKTLYAVGNFTTVSGKSHSRIVALNAATGAVVDSFKASLSAPASAVATYGSTVWAGGAFTSANGRARAYLAGFAASTGSVTGWQPKPDARVQALTVSPDGRAIVVGGHFDTMNGAVAKGSAKLDTTSGTTNQAWKINSVVQNNGADSAVYSLTSDRSYVYGTGYAYSPKTVGRHLEGAFVADWSGGGVHWIEDCHGDTYSSAVSGGVVYVAGHPHYCRNVGGFPDTDPKTYQRGLAFSLGATGTLKAESSGYSNFGGQPSPTLLTWYPDINTGSYTGQGQGPWSTAANAQYVVYGGEFTKVNGKAQQGLVRFAVKSLAPNKDGPRVSGAAFVPSLTAIGGGKVQVSFVTDYDRDNQYLDYTLYRDGQVVATFNKGSRIWYDRPTVTWTNSGLTAGRTYQYSLKVADPFGNTATGAAASVTAK